MLLTFLSILVAGTNIIFGYNFIDFLILEKKIVLLLDIKKSLVKSQDIT